MTDAVRDSYDARAKQHANFALDDLDRVPLDREWLGAFARLASPGSKFHVGDLTSLDIANSSLAGIVARYSLIHVRLPPLRRRTPLEKRAETVPGLAGAGALAGQRTCANATGGA